MTSALVLLLAALPPALPAPQGVTWTEMGGGPAMDVQGQQLAFAQVQGAPDDVARALLRVWKGQGVPTTSQGDFRDEGAVAAFFPDVGLQQTVVLQRRGPQTQLIASTVLLRAPASRSVEGAPPAPPPLEELGPGRASGPGRGQWVRYRLSGPGARVGFFKWRVTEVARSKGEELQVSTELTFGMEAQQRAPLARLTMTTPWRLGRWGRPGHVWLTLAGAAPREVPAAAFWPLPPLPTLPSSPAPQALKVAAGPAQRLTTDAGQISARPVSVAARGRWVWRVWLSQEIPWMHVARLEFPAGGQRMEVLGYGTEGAPDAETHAPR